MPLVLALAAGAKAALLALALIGLVLVLGLVVMAIRNRTRTTSTTTAQPDSLLSDLRRLRATGVITEEEHARYRANLAARLSGLPLPHPNMPPVPGPEGSLTARSGYDLTGEPLPEGMAPAGPARTGPNPPPEGRSSPDPTPDREINIPHPREGLDPGGEVR